MSMKSFLIKIKLFWVCYLLWFSCSTLPSRLEKKQSDSVIQETNSAIADKPTPSIAHSPTTSTDQDEALPPPSQFGFSVGISKNSYKDRYNHRKVLYGSPDFQIDFQSEFWLKSFTHLRLGLELGLSVAKDTGKAAAGEIDINQGSLKRDLEEDEIDPSSTMELTHIPISLNFTTETKDFFGWLGASFWIGMQRIYYQELRVGTRFVSSGYQNAGLFGLGAIIRLDKIDPAGVRSLGTMGIGSVAIVPFWQKVNQQKSSLVLPSASAWGLMFRFDS